MHSSHPGLGFAKPASGRQRHMPAPPSHEHTTLEPFLCARHRIACYITNARVAGPLELLAQEADKQRRIVVSRAGSLTVAATPKNVAPRMTPHIQRRLSSIFRCDPISHERQFNYGTKCEFCLRKKRHRQVEASPADWSRVLDEIKLDWRKLGA